MNNQFFHRSPSPDRRKFINAKSKIQTLNKYCHRSNCQILSNLYYWSHFSSYRTKSSLRIIIGGAKGWSRDEFFPRGNDRCFRPDFERSSRGRRRESEGRNLDNERSSRIPPWNTVRKPLWRIKRIIRQQAFSRKETSNRPTSSDILNPLRYRV